MRLNQPVTRQEYQLPEDAAIISRTNSRGEITDCNAAFVQASGFAREELIGQSHNIVRHPDMPPEAFRDLWATLKAGRPWSGIVKNRRKNGDFYWVRASVTPLPDGSGYVSVRVRPTAAEVARAQALYATLGTQQLREGQCRPRGPWAAFSRFVEGIPRLHMLTQLLVCVLLLALAGAGFHTLDSMKESAAGMGQGKDVVADILPPPLYLVEARLLAEELLQAGTAERQRLSGELARLKREYDERNRFWQGEALDEAVRAPLLGAQRSHADAFWAEVFARYLPALQAGNGEAARQSLGRLREHYTAHRAAVDQTVAIANRHAGEKLLQLDETAARNRLILLVAALLGSLVTLGLALPMAAANYRRLAEASTAARAFAAGDLTCDMPPAGTNEIGELVARITIMRNSLIELVASIHQNTGSVRDSSGQLAVAASDSAQASASQSDAASGIAAAIEELSVAIDEVEKRAGEVRQITRQSGQRSADGSEVIYAATGEMQRIADTVKSTARTIGELEASYAQISNVVNVIRDIADQTNLLALNAAIEAARAGDHGRGFAVVADEVRKLSERTSLSTQEITTMIAGIQADMQRAVDEMQAGVQRVDAGVELARQAGQSVADIRHDGEQVACAVDDISLAIREQMAAAHDIARRVEMIAQGAEQNSASVGRTAELARQLQAMADALNTSAERFRIV